MLVPSPLGATSLGVSDLKQPPFGSQTASLSTFVPPFTKIIIYEWMDHSSSVQPMLTAASSPYESLFRGRQRQADRIPEYLYTGTTMSFTKYDYGPSQVGQKTLSHLRRVVEIGEVSVPLCGSSLT